MQGGNPLHIKKNTIMQKHISYIQQSEIIATDYNEGISIEQTMRKVTMENAPIENVVPEIYTERKDGVLPQYNPRTDRFDIALDTMEKAQAAQIAERERVAKLEQEQTQAQNEGKEV